MTSPFAYSRECVEIFTCSRSVTLNRSQHPSAGMSQRKEHHGVRFDFTARWCILYKPDKRATSFCHWCAYFPFIVSLRTFRPCKTNCTQMLTSFENRVKVSEIALWCITDNKLINSVFTHIARDERQNESLVLHKSIFRYNIMTL